jgi:hypothetical protein
MKREKLEEIEKDIRRLRTIISKQQNVIEEMESDPLSDQAFILVTMRVRDDAKKILEEKIREFSIEEARELAAQSRGGEPDGRLVAKTTTGRGAVDIRIALRKFHILSGTLTYGEILEGIVTDRRRK